MRCLTLIPFLFLLVPCPAFGAWTNITSSSSRWILASPAQRADRHDVPGCGAVLEVLSNVSRSILAPEEALIHLNFRGTSARLFGATLAHGPVYKVDADARIFGNDEAAHQGPVCQQLAEWDNLDPNTQHTLAVEVPFGSVLVSAVMINEVDGENGSDTTVDPAPRPPATSAPSRITSAPPDETLAVQSSPTTATDADTRVPESNDLSSNTSIAPPSGSSPDNSSNTSAPEDSDTSSNTTMATSSSVVSAPSSGQTSTQRNAGPSSGLIVAIVLGVLVPLLAVAVLLVRRRRRALLVANSGIPRPLSPPASRPDGQDVDGASVSKASILGMLKSSRPPQQESQDLGMSPSQIRDALVQLQDEMRELRRGEGTMPPSYGSERDAG